MFLGTTGLAPVFSVAFQKTKRNATSQSGSPLTAVRVINTDIS